MHEVLLTPREQEIISFLAENQDCTLLTLDIEKPIELREIFLIIKKYQISCVTGTSKHNNIP